MSVTSPSDLNSILASYLEAEDAGRAPDRATFIAQHPEFAAELAEFFANQAEFDLRAKPLGPARAAAARGTAASFWRSGDQHGGATAQAAGKQFGDYELLDEIARGGMGIVYRARHVGLGRVVGLKVIVSGRFASAAELERFRREALASAMLDHPNLVPTYEVGECDGQPFFTMKLVEGRSLAERLGDWRNDPRAIARIMGKIARAVHFAHQRGIIHRDLKPANIVIDPSDEPHVTDFGLARCLGSSSDLTESGAVLGTPSYMAPEQAAGSKQTITTGADVYSLGAILYAMLTGRPPFRADTPVETLRLVTEQEPDPPSRINRQMDRDLETICLKCLEKDSRRRYGSAEALADDLDRWLDHRPIRARRASGFERLIKWGHRKPAVAGLVTVTAIATLLLIAGMLWSNARLQAEIKNVAAERSRAEANFDRSEEHRLRAEERERIARRHLYETTMNLAVQAWESGQVGRVLAMLEQQRPKPGQEDLRGFEWYYLWRQCHRAHVATIRVANTPVHCVAYSADGASLVTGCDDGWVRSFDAATAAPTDSFLAHDAAVKSLAISPDGRTIVSAGRDRTAKIWQLGDSQPRHIIPVNSYQTTTSLVALSPDGTRVVSCRPDARLQLTDTASGESLGKFEGHTAALNAVAYSPDGRRMASGANDFRIRLWDLDTGDSNILGGHNYYPMCVVFSRDGSLLASAGEEGVVKLWDVATRMQRDSWVAHAGCVYSLAFSPDGTLLASAGEDGTAKIRDLQSGEAVDFPHVGPVYSVCFSADGEQLASASADGSVKLWRVRSTREPETIGTHANKRIVYSLDFSPDGRTLVSGGDRFVKLWDVTQPSAPKTLEGHRGKVVAVAFTADGRTVISANSIDAPEPESASSERGAIKLWDHANGDLVATIDAHEQAAWGIAASPDGSEVASAGYTDKTVAIWDLATCSVRRRLVGHAERLFCVAYAPDGKTLASGCVNNSPDDVGAIIWDAQSGDILHQLRVPWVWSVAFSPDSRLLAIASDGGVVTLWDAVTGEKRLSYRGHTTSVRAVRFFPDGRAFVTASDDKTIKIWDVVTGQERATLRGPGHFWSIAISPNGRTLAAGRGDGAISVWHAATIDEVRRQSARPQD